MSMRLLGLVSLVCCFAFLPQSEHAACDCQQSQQSHTCKPSTESASPCLCERKLIRRVPLRQCAKIYTKDTGNYLELHQLGFFSILFDRCGNRSRVRSGLFQRLAISFYCRPALTPI